MTPLLNPTGIGVAAAEMKITEQHDTSPDGDNKSGDHMADLHHAPDTGLKPDWETLDKNARFGVDRTQKYDAKGKRIHERKTHLLSAAVATSDVIGGKLSNRRWLGSYTPQYVKTAGHEYLSPGVRSNVAFTNAEYGYGIFEIENVFRQPGEFGAIAPFSITSLSTKLAANPVAKPMTGSEFETYCKATGLHKDSTDAYASVFKITVHIPRSGARYVEHRPAVLRHTRLNHAGWDTVRQETRQSATEFSGKDLVIEMFFPGTSRLPPDLFGDLESTIASSKQNPYERLVTKVPRTRTFKSMRDMPSVQECGFIMPDAPVMAFSGVDEQSVRLGIALRDEYQLEESLMALTKKRPCNTLALRLNGHQVKGVDGGFLFIFIDSPADIIPEIGERFSVRLDNVPFAQPDSPTTALTDNQRCKSIADCIIEACDVARSVARKDDNLFLGYIYDALDQVLKDGEQRDVFMKYQAKKIMPHKGTPATDYRAATPSELPADHQTRIRDWVKDKFSRGILKTPDKILDRCPDMPAVRIVMPSWLEPLGAFVAYVRAPNVPEWPKTIKPTPVVDVKFPRISIQSSLYETVRTARKHMKHLKFTTRFIRRAHDGQMNAGLHALDLAGKDTWELSEGHDATFARLIAKGGGPAIDYDIMEALPLLKEFMAHVKSESTPTNPVLKACLAIYNKLDADQKLVFDDLTALPFGIRIISGGPGSGKNFVVQLFMALAQHSEVVEDVVNGWLNTTVPLPAQGTTTNDRSSDDDCATQQPTVSANDEACSDNARREIKTSKKTLGFGDEMSDSDACSARHQGKLVILAPSNELLDKMAIDLRDLYAELKLKKRICRVQMPGTASSDMERRLGSEPSRSAYDEYIPEEGDAVFETEIYLRRLSQECLDQYRFIDPPGGEFAVSALVAKRIANPVPGDDLAEHAADIEAERSSDPDNFHLTCIKILRKLLKKARDDEYLAADVLLSTPEAWFKLSCEKLPMKITALWMDESFRMTEPEALIGLQYAHQAKVRFMTGDNEQCKPIVKSINAHKSKDDDRVFCAQFASQLGLALPSRMMASGYEHIILNHNHRAQGGVSEFPNKQFYHGNMLEDNVEKSPEQERLIKYFGVLSGHKSGPMLMLNMPGGMEARIGTSFSNPGSIKLIIDLLKQMHHDNMLCKTHPTDECPGELISILVVFPYKEQAQLFKRELGKVPPADLAKDRIKWGVVQAIQGMQAECVIWDLTRDTQAGYTGQAQLNNVALTRAKYGVITITCDQLWTGKESSKQQNDRRIQNIVALYKHCADREAVVNVSKSYFKDRLIDTYIKECPVCPPGEDRHASTDCPKAWSTPMRSAIPAGYQLPEKLCGLGDNLLNDRQKFRTKTRLTFREQLGLQDRESVV